jgi:hypothetical protein
MWLFATVGSEGERRSSVLSTAQDDGAVAALAPGQRWSLARKREVVLRLMQGEPVAPVWAAGVEAGALAGARHLHARNLAAGERGGRWPSSSGSRRCRRR